MEMLSSHPEKYIDHMLTSSDNKLLMPPAIMGLSQRRLFFYKTSSLIVMAHCGMGIKGEGGLIGFKDIQIFIQHCMRTFDGGGEFLLILG